MQVERTGFEPGSTGADSVLSDSSFDSIGTPSCSLSEPEVVVRRDVERPRLGPGQLERLVLVVGFTVEQGDRPSSDTGSRSRETIVQSEFKSTGVEGIEIGHQRSVAL